MTLEENRLKLHAELIEILGSRNVYFQPPENTKIKYPAIVYSREDLDDTHANNEVYTRKIRYQIKLIDSNPINDTIEKLSHMKYCSFDRHFNSDNLNHDIFTIFY